MEKISKKYLVLEFLNSLPKNKVTTYLALAKKFCSSPRAIASFMRTNTHPEKYPCYKVVWKKWSLTGYRLGLQEKEKRLLADWVVLENWVVKKEFIIEEF